jgi:hypothetical protein
LKRFPLELENGRKWGRCRKIDTRRRYRLLPFRAWTTSGL